MNVLKGLALGLLSFLLVLSLSIFGIAFLVNQTILNRGFIASEINRLDVPLLAEEFLSEYIPEEEPMAEVLSDTITDLEPWIQQQLTDIAYAGYDYLRGRSETLSVVIPLEPVKESLRDNRGETISELVPSTFELNEDSLGAELSAQLELARQVISYIQPSYNFLIGFMLLLILGIVLIDRQVRSATRKLGAIFLPEGVLMLVGVFIIKYFARTQVAQLDVTPYLEEWLPQLVSDFVAPLLMLSIGLIVGGVVLLTVSFVYKRQT
jgi:hypothetical protein